MRCLHPGTSDGQDPPQAAAEGAWAATGWSPELGLEGPYRPSSRATGRSKKEQSTGCGSQFIIIMESTSRGCFPPRPWPMLQGRPGKSAEGTQCPWEDVPAKAPTEMGQPGLGAGVCHSKERWEATAQTKSTCCSPTALSKSGLQLCRQCPQLKTLGEQAAES